MTMNSKQTSVAASAVEHASNFTSELAQPAAQSPGNALYAGKAQLKRGQTSKTLERGCGSKSTQNWAQPAVEVNNQRDFVRYWHSVFGYPSKTTFVSNILNGNIVIDGLSVSTLRRNL